VSKPISIKLDRKTSFTSLSDEVVVVGATSVVTFVGIFGEVEFVFDPNT